MTSQDGSKQEQAGRAAIEYAIEYETPLSADLVTASSRSLARAAAEARVVLKRGRSGQFDLDVDPADGFGSLKNGRRTNLAHAEGLGV